MNNDDFRELLRDTATGAPDVDLAPGALRAARRRRMATGTALGGVAAVSALAVWLGAVNAPGLLAVPAGAPASASAPVPTPASSDLPTPTGSVPPGKGQTYQVPDVGLQSLDLPWSLPLTSDSPDLNLTTAWGLTCNLDRPKAVDPSAGRGWDWGSVDAGKSRAISEIVLGWHDVKTAMRQVRNDTGRCAYSAAAKVVTNSEDTYLATDVAFGRKAAIGIRVVGNLTVGVSVFGTGADTPTFLADHATKLLDAAQHRIEADHFDQATFAAVATAPVPKPKPTTIDTGAIEIPATLALKASELPWRMPSLGEFGGAGITPLADGLSCQDSPPAAQLPIAGRQWSWGGGSRPETDLRMVGLHITGWDDASGALAELKANRGFCQFLDPLTVVTDTANRYVVTASAAPVRYVIATQRINRVIVAVTVTAPSGKSASLVSTAEKLLDRAVVRAIKAGLDQK